MRRRLALVALLLGGTAASAQQVSATWVGQYLCSQGNTAVNLTIIEGKGGAVDAWFHFLAPLDNPAVPTGCYTMTGTYEAPTRQLRLAPGAWLHQPMGYEMVRLAGEVSTDGAALEGVIDHPSCGRFVTARRAGPAATRPCRDGEPLLSMR